MFEGQLLLSRAGHSQLFIYKQETDQYRLPITIAENDKLYDATWTPKGYIVYTTFNTKKVVVISTESGSAIATHTHITDPRLLSMSDDKKIYLADYDTGVYESTDDGVNWNFVFESRDDWHCWQVIKVRNGDSSDDFWTLEKKRDDRHLRVYKRYSDGKLTWKNIIFTPAAGNIDLSKSSLSYDRKTKAIFLSERHNKAVHKLSVEGQYQRQFLSSHDIKNKPWRLAVDGESLYVGQFDGVVEVFPLKSGNDD